MARRPTPAEILGNPNSTPTEISKAYEQGLRFWKSEYVVNEFRHVDHGFDRFFKRLDAYPTYGQILPVTSKTALVVFGGGRLVELDLVKEKPCVVVVFDGSAKAIDKARQHGEEHGVKVVGIEHSYGQSLPVDKVVDVAKARGAENLCASAIFSLYATARHQRQIIDGVFEAGAKIGGETSFNIMMLARQFGFPFVIYLFKDVFFGLEPQDKKIILETLPGMIRWGKESRPFSRIQSTADFQKDHPGLRIATRTEAVGGRVSIFQVK